MRQQRRVHPPMAALVESAAARWMA